MLDPIDSHSLFTQLQARYPTGSLITDLVQIQPDQMIVRAQVLVSGTPLVTAMAAAATVEQAEDQARLRVLQLLGIVAAPGMVSPSFAPFNYDMPPLAPMSGPESNGNLPETVSPIAPAAVTSVDPLSAAGVGAEVLSPAGNPEPLSSTDGLAPLPSLPEVVLPPPLPDSMPEPMPEPMLEPEVTAFPEAPEPFLPEPESALPEPESFSPEPKSVPSPPTAPAPVVKTTSSGKAGPVPKSTRDRKSGPTATAGTAPLEEDPEALGASPIDLSDLIVLTDVEMERVGWSKKRGQTHLKQTYNKQTRAELDEEQMMEFLHFLRALPSKS